MQEVVNIGKRCCSCRIWQVDDFPCCHAIAALWKKKLSPYAFVSRFYFKEAYVATYAESIYPSGLNIFTDDPVVNGTNISSILLPDVRRPPGRPKRSRIPSAGERTYKSGHCGSCGKVGHNSRTCKYEGDISIQREHKKKSIQLY